MEAQDRIIYSIDTPSAIRAKEQVERFSDTVGMFKVQWPLIMATGENIIRNFLLPVMCDFRLGDEPMVMRKTISIICPTKAKFITISPFAPRRSIEAAVQTADKNSMLVITTPQVFMSDADFQWINADYQQVNKTTIKIIGAALNLGVQAIYCSPAEVKLLKDKFPHVPIICNEVAQLGADDGSDNHYDTVFSAFKNGADYMVVGPLVLFDNHPDHVVEGIVARIKNALKARDGVAANFIPAETVLQDKAKGVWMVKPKQDPRIPGWAFRDIEKLKSQLDIASDQINIVDPYEMPG